jgi:hypothetical protein
MDSREQAKYAKDTLHGKFLTAIRSAVDVVFSNMRSLSIDRNTSRAWDFVKEPRAPAPSAPVPAPSAYDRQSYYEADRFRRQPSPPRSYAPPPPSHSSYSAPPPPPTSYAPPPRDYAGYEYDPYSAQEYGYNRPPSPRSYSSTPQYGYEPHMHYDHGYQPHGYQQVPPQRPPYSDFDIDLRPEPGQVLLVSNFDPEKVKDPVDLFKLFGAYGNVIRIRILMNKPDAALIQFENSMFAQTARKFLDRFEFRGRKLSVTTSKYDELASNTGTNSKGDSTREFFNRAEHRYRVSDLETYRKNTVAPRPYLFVTGVKGASKEEIETLFSKCGKVRHVEFADNKPGICWIEMEDAHAATEAIVNLHDADFKTNFLRVSFSPKSDFKSGRQKRKAEKPTEEQSAKYVRTEESLPESSDSEESQEEEKEEEKEEEEESAEK